MFHESFAEYLREGCEPEEAHLRLLDLFRSQTPSAEDGSVEWLRAHPYALRYLSLHAMEAGRIDEYICDPGFLIASDPLAVRLVVSRCTSEEGRRWGAVYMLASHCLGETAAERASYLELTARKQGERRIADRFKALKVGRTWRCTEARGKAASPHFVLSGHQEMVTSVAVGTRAGRAVIVSGSDEQTVRVWDLETLEPIGAPLEGHQDRVTSMAVGNPGGQRGDRLGERRPDGAGLGSGDYGAGGRAAGGPSGWGNKRGGGNAGGPRDDRLRKLGPYGAGVGSGDTGANRRAAGGTSG